MGKRMSSKPPSVKANEEYGMRPRKKISKATMNLGKGMGNVESGFMPRTPKAATGAMMGRAMPSPGKAKTSTRKDSRKQFGKASGRKVF